MKNEEVLQKRIERIVKVVTNKCCTECDNWDGFRLHYQKLVNKGTIASFRLFEGDDWQYHLTYTCPKEAGSKKITMPIDDY